MIALPEVRVTADEVAIRWPDRPGVLVVNRDGRTARELVDPPFSIPLQAPKEALEEVATR